MVSLDRSRLALEIFDWSELHMVSNMARYIEGRKIVQVEPSG